MHNNYRKKEWFILQMQKNEYMKYAGKAQPKSHIWINTIKAFIVGGTICTIGQGLLTFYKSTALTVDAAAAATSVTLIALSALLTGLGLYDRIARHAGAGTLVPITGFANSVVSAALEFKSEGFVTGMCAKMFSLAGPVLVFGISASVIYGLFHWIFG